MRVIIILSFLLQGLLLNAQNDLPEVYIIGTMHTVPKIVKGSYKPMLKKAIKYQPEAIFVETTPGDDEASWEYLKDGWSKHMRWFYNYSDSMRQHYRFDDVKHEAILGKAFTQMSTQDLETLMQDFAYLRDNANFGFYKYILKHGISGSRKATRHENGDLTYKLALKLNQKLVIPMDHQAFNGKYHDAWKQCVEEGKSNGNNVIVNQLNKKDYNRAVFPALFGKLGKHTNKLSSFSNLHKMSSFTYAQISTPGCVDGEKFWEARNRGMAINISRNIQEKQLSKSVVIVGAAHVYGLAQILKTEYPNLKVKLMDENALDQIPLLKKSNPSSTLVIR